MEELSEVPRVLSDNSGVAFCITAGEASALCIISIQALEDCFWLPQGADPAHVLIAFGNGFNRIRAVAERKMRASASPKILLKPADFRRSG
ncbi:DUF1488 family protein [Paraburkholderia acidisoli]|uniref:DUF1488 family protein n=1 Tax=Paraburkholderia acidisoli TaxID=2571748 RepID=A0A7Z2JL15_9BURK|nr:DUF1488 family protein [Paraburkholderia acidisoli]QGZ67070.1 DUF1488 family protein [Paraburkholderia acidisoli]